MDQRHNGADAELPLKAESQVDHDAGQRHQHAEAALVAQLFTDLRAHELNALDRRRVVAADLLQGLGYLMTQLRIFARHTHQQVGGRTKALHDGFVIAGLDQLVAHQGHVGRLLVGQLDERTAGEIQTVVQPLMEPAEQRQNGEDHGEAERNVANAHEVDCT